MSWQFHPRFINHIYPSSNKTKQEVHRISFNAKFDFKSLWSRDSTACYHKHPVSQYAAEDTKKLTRVGQDILGTNRIFGNGHMCPGGFVTSRENCFEKWFINSLWSVILFIDLYEFLSYFSVVAWLRCCYIIFCHLSLIHFGQTGILLI